VSSSSKIHADVLIAALERDLRAYLAHGATRAGLAAVKRMWLLYFHNEYLGFPPDVFQAEMARAGRIFDAVLAKARRAA
jgi:hypothetical protein